MNNEPLVTDALKKQTAKSTPASALVGVAVLHILASVWIWSIQGISWNINDCIGIGGSIFLLAMSAWARWQPFPPVAISSALYALLIGLQIQRGVLTKSLIICILEGVIVLLLGVALWKTSGPSEKSGSEDLK